jgi:hypothetical protein
MIVVMRLNGSKIMTRIVVERRVNNDGLLQLAIPLGSEEAGRDVRLTIELVGSEKEMTPEEWRSGILATAGAWQGEFERPGEGELEERDLLS